MAVSLMKLDTCPTRHVFIETHKGVSVMFIVQYLQGVLEFEWRIVSCVVCGQVTGNFARLKISTGCAVLH